MSRIIETTETEKEYFIHNKTRIIITEHFNEKGKPFMELVGNAIERNTAVDSHTIKDRKTS